MRARKPKGSVVFNRLRATWNFLWCEGNQGRSRKLGPLVELPTKADALRKAEAVRRDLRLQRERAIVTVRQLVEQFRVERMPERFSTRYGYEAWLKNHVLPCWGDSPITDLQARPVELWLKSLPLSPKSRVHIRGVIHQLWEFAMWRSDVPTQRNPMSLVTIKGATKRLRKPHSLTEDEFRKFLAQLEEPFLGSGTTIIAAERTGRVCYGVELDPQYVDTAIRRWQSFTGLSATHGISDRSFKELEQEAVDEHKR